MDPHARLGRPPEPAPRARLLELAALFGRLGFTAFGGPAAHIALMEDEVVRRRGWLRRDEFLDLLGAVQLIPGPNSTELAMHIGLRRAGAAGLVVAGLAFILPAALIVAGLAAVYVHTRAWPVSAAVLDGLKPAVLAVVVQALLRLGAQVARDRPALAVAGVAAAVHVLGAHELAVLAGAGAVLAAWRGRRGPRAGPAARPELATALPGLAAGAAAATASMAPGPWQLFLTFARIGSVLYGSGYVLLAFLRADLVQRAGWLDDATLLDAVAVGQVTPGPVLTTATFIGYLLAGPAGAAAATAGIFLPAFVFTGATGWLVPRLRASRTASAFLDGVNAASLALMAVVAARLARAALGDGWGLALAVGAWLGLTRTRLGATAVLLLAGAAGVLIRLAQGAA